MPACLIDEKHGVGAWRDGWRSRKCNSMASVLQDGKMRAGPFPLLWTDRAEDIGGGGPLIDGGHRAACRAGPTDA